MRCRFHFLISLMLIRLAWPTQCCSIAPLLEKVQRSEQQQKGALCEPMLWGFALLPMAVGLYHGVDGPPAVGRAPSGVDGPSRPQAREVVRS